MLKREKIDINKPLKQKPTKIETMSTSKVLKCKPKPGKLMLILGIIAGLTLLSAIVIFAVSVLNTKNLEQIQASNLARCPDANKQHPGHCISSNIKSIELSSGKPIEYKFQILDDNAKPITNFAIGHEKIMHVFLIRKDRIGFQHLHPDFDKASGTFTIKDLVIPAEGSYRLFADFIDGNISNQGKAAMTIYEDLQIGEDKTTNAPVSTKEITKNFNTTGVVLLTQPEIISVGVPIKITLLLSDITKNGIPVDNLKPYLGAYGHAVLFDDKLNIVHTHATSGQIEASRGIVEFSFTPTTAGNLALFAQVQLGGEVVTMDFGLLVNKSLSEIDQKINSGAHDGH